MRTVERTLQRRRRDRETARDRRGTAHRPSRPSEGTLERRRSSSSYVVGSQNTYYLRDLRTRRFVLSQKGVSRCQSHGLGAEMPRKTCVDGWGGRPGRRLSTPVRFEGRPLSAVQAVIDKASSWHADDVRSELFERAFAGTYEARAACRGCGPCSDWFPVRGEAPGPATEACGTCRVKAPCLIAGILEAPVAAQHGIRAGRSALWRTKLMRAAIREGIDIVSIVAFFHLLADLRFSVSSNVASTSTLLPAPKEIAA